MQMYNKQHLIFLSLYNCLDYLYLSAEQNQNFMCKHFRIWEGKAFEVGTLSSPIVEWFGYGSL